MNKAKTRAELIDPALKAAGWGAVEGNRIRREYVIIPGRIEGKNKRGKVLKANDLLEHHCVREDTWNPRAHLCWRHPVCVALARRRGYRRRTSGFDVSRLWGQGRMAGAIRQCHRLSDLGQRPCAPGLLQPRLPATFSKCI